MELVSTLHAAFHAANKVFDESVSELDFAPKSMMLYHSPLVNIGGRKMKNMNNERAVSFPDHILVEAWQKELRG